MKPTVGRIVNYVLEEGPNTGEIRPAIIVKVWSDDMVQLQVFVDNTNDRIQQGLATGLIWKTSVRYSEAADLRSWHWPVRV